MELWLLHRSTQDCQSAGSLETGTKMEAGGNQSKKRRKWVETGNTHASPGSNAASCNQRWNNEPQLRWTAPTLRSSAAVQMFESALICNPSNPARGLLGTNGDASFQLDFRIKRILLILTAESETCTYKEPLNASLLSSSPSPRHDSFSLISYITCGRKLSRGMNQS